MQTHNTVEVNILKHINNFVKQNFIIIAGIICSALACAIFIPVMHSVRGAGAVGGEFFAIILIGLMGARAASAVSAKLNKNHKAACRKTAARKSSNAKIIPFADIKKSQHVTGNVA